MPFQDDAQRVGCVAVCIGALAGLDRLVGCDHGPRGGVQVAFHRIGHGQVAAIRHAVLPLLAIALVQAAGLPPGQQAVVVAFAALPTASSAYVLATRMGGNGGYVAGLVSLSTLIAMVGMPLALAGVAWAQPG